MWQKKVKVNPVEEKKAEKVSLSVSVFDSKGVKSGTMKLPEEIFGAKISPVLMAQAVRVYLANQRIGGANTKTRGEVIGSTRKIYQQKGTGRARHGARKAPIFRGGGITFGPRTRDFSLIMPQQMKRNALFSALSAKVKDGKVLVVENVSGMKGKTKEVSFLLKALNVVDKKNKANKVLFVSSGEEVLMRAARNIDGLTLSLANTLNTYGVMNSKNIIFVKESIELLTKTFLNRNK